MPGAWIDVTVTGFEPLAVNLTTGLSAVAALEKVVQKYAIATQAQAVRNVSGTSVTYQGGTFTVNRVTGKLAQSIQIVPAVAPLTRVVAASAAYADAIEMGTGAVDMKPFLMGKTVPIRVPAGTAGAKRMTLRNLQGGVSSHPWIIFRRVGPHSTGWIRPAQRPRPFMHAAAETIAPAFRRAVEQAYAQFLTPPGP